MRSGVPLSEIRKEVMIEAGLSTQAGHAAFNTERLNHMINRMERLMMAEGEWPTLHFEERVTVLADAQYADLPEHISFTMIETAHVAYGSEWLPITQGIGARERTIYNESQRAAPIQKYEVGAERPTQFEVWPIGSSDQTILFQGNYRVGEMASEVDQCALDADVIVLRVAAEILGRDNQADAELKLSLANSHTNKILKRQGAMKRDPINTGRVRKDIRRPGIDYIPPGSG